MGAVDADGLAIGQAAHIVPDDLFVAEARPAVLLRLIYKLLNRASARGNEQWLATHGVVVGDLSRIGAQRLEPCSRRLERIARVLSIVPIEAANPVSGLKVAPIAQLLLHGLLSGAVRLLTHDVLATDDGVLRCH